MEVEPAALHGEKPSIEPNARALRIEDLVLHQIERIGYLRSLGQPWTEPVTHLRDLIVGLEDDEFWTGFPEGVKKENLSDEEIQEYELRGWNKLRIRVKTRRVGKVTIREPDPTPQELSLMVRIIMALLARQGMTWRRKSTDEITSDF